MTEVVALICLTILAIVAMTTSRQMLKDEFGDNNKKGGNKKKQ